MHRWTICTLYLPNKQIETHPHKINLPKEYFFLIKKNTMLFFGYPVHVVFFSYAASFVNFLMIYVVAPLVKCVKQLLSFAP